MTVRVELWELPGPHWRMPLRVVWHAELAEVRVGFGCNLTVKMRTAAEQKLLTVATLKGNTFWLTKEALGKIAKQSRSEDPEEVIEWLPPRTPEPIDLKGYDASDFIRGYCSQSYSLVRDPLQAEMIWLSFCKFMMHWLLNEQKTVDLVFAKLNAFLLRRNWAAATARFERDAHRKGKILKSDRFKPDPHRFIENGILEYWLSSSIVGFDEEARFPTHTLDVITTDEWRKFDAKLEQHRSVACKRNTLYIVNVMNRMKKQLPRLMEAYVHYLEETSKPGMDLGGRDPESGSTVRTGWGSRKAVAVGGPDATDVQMRAQASPETSVATPDASVPEVPDLQHGNEGVR